MSDPFQLKPRDLKGQKEYFEGFAHAMLVENQNLQKELDALRDVAKAADRFSMRFSHTLLCFQELEYGECDCGKNTLVKALAEWRKLTGGKGEL